MQIPGDSAHTHTHTRTTVSAKLDFLYTSRRPQRGRVVGQQLCLGGVYGFFPRHSLARPLVFPFSLSACACLQARSIHSDRCCCLKPVPFVGFYRRPRSIPSKDASKVARPVPLVFFKLVTNRLLMGQFDRLRICVWTVQVRQSFAGVSVTLATTCISLSYYNTIFH